MPFATNNSNFPLFKVIYDAPQKHCPALVGLHGCVGLVDVLSLKQFQGLSEFGPALLNAVPELVTFELGVHYDPLYTLSWESWHTTNNRVCGETELVHNT